MSPRSVGTGAGPPRVLLAEDYFAVAEFYADLLGRLGYHVLGPAASVDRALGIVDSEPVDGAVLDIALRGRVVTPVAERLRAQGRPFVFLSGMADLDVLPPHLLDAPRIEKPATSREVVSALRRAGFSRIRVTQED